MQFEQSSGIKVIIVIPFFNEERHIANTCASLGFGISEHLVPKNSILILVDNNSTDSSISIAETIKNNSKKDSVVLGFESTQGFVPARHRGNLIAKAIAESQDWNIDETLILQADADTNYSENYVNVMKSKSEIVGQNTIIEACSEYPTTFKQEYQSYINLCNNLDNEFCNLFPNDLSDDNIVDDKAVGYRLSDYFKWGGHQQEFNILNEEIYAETSRLYMAARTKGAKRIIVDNATVFHSVRKILKNPLLHLATAGFPRENSWNNRWILNYGNEFNLFTVPSQIQNPKIIKAIQARKLHIIGLFCILPLKIQFVLGKELNQKMPSYIGSLLQKLPNRTINNLCSHPGLFLSDIFKLLEDQEDNILAGL